MSTRPLRTRPIIQALSIAIPLSYGCVPTPPNGDYGDAPDGQPTGYTVGPGAGTTGAFPSSYNTSNARVAGRHGIVHVDTLPDLIFGEALTLEADALLPDLDADDGSPMLGILNGQDGQFRIDVTARDDGNPGQPVSGFINVAADFNQDGEWRNAASDEWVVENHPVTVPRGETRRILLPPFAFAPTSVRAELWARFSLTPQAILDPQFQVDGWDGSGPAAGYDDGETEDVLFACEGGLRITYARSDDSWGNRLTAVGDVVTAPGVITVENLANQVLVYDFRAKAAVAFDRPGGWRYGPTTSEYTLTLTPVGTQPPPGFPRVAPSPIVLPPNGPVSIGLAAAGTPGDSVSFNVSAQVDRVAAAGNLAVVNDVTHPTGQWDNILGRLSFYPIGPCIAEYQQVGPHPIYLDWP